MKEALSLTRDSDRKTAYASAPARVCLYGDNVDWISGPAILCAIDNLRTYTCVKEIKTGTIFTSDNLSGDSVSIKVDGYDYKGDWTDYLKATLKATEKRYGVNIDGLQINVNSTLPIGAGLSSSAALCVATIGALDAYFGIGMSSNEIADLAFKAEYHELHIPCGQMDQYSVAYGGILYVNCKDEPPQDIEKFKPRGDLVIVIGDTRMSKSTAHVINAIKARLTNKDPLINQYVDIAEKIILQARTHLRSSIWDINLIGEWMNVCQDSMRNHLKTSNQKLDTFCEIAIVSGATGAKLSGSGMGGCMFALCRRENQINVMEGLVSKGAVVFPGNIAEEGVRIEDEMSFEQSKASSYKLT